MAAPKSTRLTPDQEEAVEDMVESGEATNDAEALRMFITAGMAEYGYVAGRQSETALKTFTERLAWAFALVGVVWLATTLFLPVVLRTPAVFAFSASLGAFGVHRVLDAYEPTLTEKMRSLLGGGESA